MYYDKLEKMIDILKKMCEDHVEFIKYDEKILSEIKNISLCFDDCKKPYCLQKETDICKFIIPENNLMSDKSNTTMYYAKISDELIRHYRLRSYIFYSSSPAMSIIMTQPPSSSSRGFSVGTGIGASI